MNAKVLSVYDEGAVEDTPYIGSKGFSVLVDVDGERTLLDTGTRGRYLIHNLDFLEIKLDSIKRVVISHNHRGNMGGLRKLLEERKEPLDIYVNGSFGQIKRMFNRPLFSEEQISKANFHIMNGNTEFSEHLAAIGPFGETEEFSLLLKTVNGPVVISSCYHSGVGPVLTEAKAVTGKDPCNLIGGLHVRKANQRIIDPIADVIKDFGSPHMHLCHCAEDGAMMYLRVRFKLKGVDNFHVGSSVEFEVE